MNTPSLNQSTILVIIDPQRGFMDLEGSALPVPGACADMARLAGFIRKNDRALQCIFVTLDTHSPEHIAHPVRWLDRNGKHPAPFTPITVEDVERGVYRASSPDKQAWHLAYVRALRERGNKTLMIWPPHCIRDTEGHEVIESLGKELDRWEQLTGTPVMYLHKGVNSDTEQYGAFGPEVQIPGFLETQINTEAIAFVSSFERQVWAGEALSHCVMASFDQVASRAAERIILTDATSPVPGFEDASRAWLEQKQREGVRLARTHELVL